MWSEWLVRTLRPRREEDETRSRKPRASAPPDLEGDGMHPGADEYRSALTKVEVEAE